MKGKLTRRKPNPLRMDVVEIPPEITEQHRNLILSVDLMYVNGLPMMTSIDRSIRFRSLVPLDSRSKGDMLDSLDKIL